MDVGKAFLRADFLLPLPHPHAAHQHPGLLCKAPADRVITSGLQAGLSSPPTPASDSCTQRLAPRPPYLLPDRVGWLANGV